jgi:hypothetical protein
METQNTFLDAFALNIQHDYHDMPAICKALRVDPILAPLADCLELNAKGVSKYFGFSMPLSWC